MRQHDAGRGVDLRHIPRQGSDPAHGGDLKTPESERDIIIPEPYSKRLLEIARDGVVDGSRWLSPQHDGSTMSCGMLGWWWRREAGAAHILLSNLRASWRTFARYEWGIDHDTCKVLMGHRLQDGHRETLPTPDEKPAHRRIR